MLNVLATIAPHSPKDTKKFCSVLHKSITLILVIASWVFAYGQTHQTVYLKYMQLFVYQLYLNKAVKVIIKDLVPLYFFETSET